MDLFSQGEKEIRRESEPLAFRMRPRTLEEFVGQEHLIGPGKVLRRMIESGKPFSFILWGPPGSGKTTLAQILASALGAHFVYGSAVLWGVKEVREVIRDAQQRLKRGQRTLLFLDEIHRFNRAQQDALLPWVEDGTIVLIGATTQNPSFGIIPPLSSRLRVFTLRALSEEEILLILKRALSDPERGLGNLRVRVPDDVLKLIAQLSQGDARAALNALELSVILSGEEGTVTPELVMEAAQRRILYDREGEEHYNLISAYQKSIRGSDPDAALYWLARMLEGGEDPLYIARRMVVTAAEDIGLADPMALVVAVAALQAFQILGQPEGELALAEATVYLATAPKSNSAMRALEAAREEVREKGAVPVPLHLRNAPTHLMRELGYGRGYLYPHDHPDAFVEQQYLPDGLRGGYYSPSGRGYEREIGERLRRWWKGRKG